MLARLGGLMSKWQEQKAEINRRALARLRKALPDIFPLTCSAGPSSDRSFHRRRVSRSTPIGATIPFALIVSARALATRSGQPVGWTWQLGKAQSGMPETFRVPPAPYRENAFCRGPGCCCVCGQPIYQFGWHIDLWRKGPNKRATWHCACVIAWQFWKAPSEQAPLLRRLQTRRCSQTGGRLWKNAQVDHRVPLYRVWSEYRGAPWPDLLNYWGMPNLRSSTATLTC